MWLSDSKTQKLSISTNECRKIIIIIIKLFLKKIKKKKIFILLFSNPFICKYVNNFLPRLD